MEVLITAASRDKRLKQEMEAFQKYVTCKDGFNIHLNEDCVPNMEESSFETVRWAKESGLFKNVYHTNPRRGRGPAMNKLKHHILKTKYFFYMEEDFVFLRHVDLDELMALMDKYPKINQLAFNDKSEKYVPKPGGPNGQDKFYYDNIDFDGHTLYLAERWTWQPAIWRTEFVLKNWHFTDARSNKNFNRQFKNGIGHKEWDHKWFEENMGVYYYGSNDDSEYVRHTEWKVRHDRLYL